MGLLLWLHRTQHDRVKEKLRVTHNSLLEHQKDNAALRARHVVLLGTFSARP